MYARVGVTLIILFYILTTITSHTLKRQKRIVGGNPAAPPPVDDPVVYVTCKGRQARIYGIRDPNKRFYVFRGIRFGLPPVGEQRFQRPIPLHLEGELNASKWGPPCPQPNNIDGKRIVGNEDCLFLNVFTPMLPDSGDGYPVLIWIHGGGFRRGSACQYEMRNIIKKKVVVVSIQYRLGSLGFLSTGTKELPGNNGIFDMKLAVKWVEDYIEFFGGNPKKIIAFGHGTGASAAFMLALSKLSRNALSGLIAMSGSILSHFAIDKDPLSTARYIASKNECPTNNTVDMIRCLQQIPVDTLIQTDTSLETMRSSINGFVSSLTTLLGPGPVIEGNDDARFLPNFMTDTPEDYLQFDLPPIPLLAGVMNDEVGGAIYGDYKDEIQNKLQTDPNFLSEKLIPVLQNTVPSFGKKSDSLPEAFKGYFNIFKTGNNSARIAKVAEAMGDSLYNVPAFLTVDHWAKKSEAFLYSFDYKGKRRYGKQFLAGTIIADARRITDDLTSHGDDLGYIFKQNTITGEPLQVNGELNEEDVRVEDVFTNMIAEFARTGKPNVVFSSESSTLFPNILPRFSSENSPFISISSAPHLMDQFRYCEIGLWTGLAERLKATRCDLFRNAAGFAQYSAKRVMDTVENPVKGLDQRMNSFELDMKIAKSNESIQNSKPTKSSSVFGNMFQRAYT